MLTWEKRQNALGGAARGAGRGVLGSAPRAFSGSAGNPGSRPTASALTPATPNRGGQSPGDLSRTNAGMRGGQSGAAGAIRNVTGVAAPGTSFSPRRATFQVGGSEAGGVLPPPPPPGRASLFDGKSPPNLPKMSSLWRAGSAVTRGATGALRTGWNALPGWGRLGVAVGAPAAAYMTAQPAATRAVFGVDPSQLRRAGEVSLAPGGRWHGTPQAQRAASYYRNLHHGTEGGRMREVLPYRQARHSPRYEEAMYQTP